MRYLILFMLPAILSCGQAKVKDVTIEGKKSKPITGLAPSAVHDKFTKKGLSWKKIALQRLLPGARWRIMKCMSLK